ncbi:MAG: ABC transporter ATP-binding protein [Clostridia bacterium]
MHDNKQQNKPPVRMGPGGGGPSMAVADKAQDFSGSLKKLFAYSKKYVGVIIFALVMAICASIITLFGPSKLSEITDIITAGLASGTVDIDSIVNICTFLAILYGIALVMNYTQGNIMATISQKLCKNLRTDSVKKLNRLPLAYFDKNSYGDTLSYITNDVDTIGISLNQSMASVISGAFTFFGAIFMMFYSNWIMAIAAIVSTIIGFAFSGTVISKSQGFFRAQQKQLGKLNGHIEETYTGHTIVKAYCSEETEKALFKQNNDELYGAAWKAQFMSGLMMPVMGFVGNLAYVVVCVVGALLTMNDVISFGVIVAFMIYVRLFTQPLSQLAQAATILQSAAAASERVFDLLVEQELPQEKENLKSKETIEGSVVFKNVDFGYDPEKLIIKNFSAEVKPGQKVAIVGPTGAGKTTIVNLLMRFYEINSGEIQIDGTPIDQIKREDLHSLFAMVLQDTWMFEGTIKQNIAYSQEGVTDEQIVNACKAVGIHHTIKTLPKGYDTIMGNSTLSAGEKQLLTIARAMVKKAELIILDEATSSVDTRTELLIGKAMDNLSKGKTSFIIAHRLSTIKNADLILVMRDGNVIESGNHENLIAKKGFYEKLYNSQFESTTSA